MTTKKTENKPRRYDGAYPAVAEHMKSAMEHYDALVGFLKKIEAIDLENQKAQEANNRLPGEITTLLRSGKMDEDTVVQLSRKRAHLDLVPARLSCLSEKRHDLKTSKEVAAAQRGVESAAHAGGDLYQQKQIEAALPDYMELGVSEDVALEQIRLRSDICSGVLEFTGSRSYSSKSWSAQIRQLLAVFDCLAAGLFPTCTEAAKIQKKWNVKLEYL